MTGALGFKKHFPSLAILLTWPFWDGEFTWPFQRLFRMPGNVMAWITWSSFHVSFCFFSFPPVATKEKIRRHSAWRGCCFQSCSCCIWDLYAGLKNVCCSSLRFCLLSLTLDIQTPRILRRRLDPQNLPKTPSQEVLFLLRLNGDFLWIPYHGNYLSPFFTTVFFFSQPPCVNVSKSRLGFFTKQ